MAVEKFGEMPDGTQVDCATISGGGLTAKILTLGSIIQDLRIEGHDKPLVLGCDDVASYLTYKAHLGATAGRVGNRIRDGHLELDGQTYQLDINFLDKHCLHGGHDGMGVRVWTFDKIEDNAVHMSIKLEDGHMGFPGNMIIRLTYSLLESGVLDIVMSAATDKTSVCNLAHHSYFNLDGSPNILEHELWLDADRFTETDDDLIPTGRVLSVEGLSIDFRKKKVIGSAVNIKPIDNNFCIEKGAGTLRKVATLSSPKSGISMDVATTEPGIQAYDSINLKPGTIGLGGIEMGPWAGFCLEAQAWPDAVHQPDFPSITLRPGETYNQHTQYIFRKP